MEFWGTRGQPGLAVMRGLGSRSSAAPQGRACGDEASEEAELWTPSEQGCLWCSLPVCGHSFVSPSVCLLRKELPALPGPSAPWLGAGACSRLLCLCSQLLMLQRIHGIWLTCFQSGFVSFKNNSTAGVFPEAFLQVSRGHFSDALGFAAFVRG